MGSKNIGYSLISGLAMASMTGLAIAAPVTVDTVGVLDPNPNSLTLVDSAGNGTGSILTPSATDGVTLANFQTAITAAYAANLGGVMDFQEQFQGGSYPNNPAGSTQNGVTIGSLVANVVTVTYGSSQTHSIGMYRNDTSADGFDAAINQGTNVISGGGSTRTGSGTSLWDFTTSPPTASAGPAGGNIIAAGGGYMGITGAANANLVFQTGLAAFGITGLPRGASRHTQITITLDDNSTHVGTSDLISTGAVFYGFALTPTELAAGRSITKVFISNPDGVNRFDDLAFIVVPEPASLGLLGLGSLALVRRRNRLV